MAAARRYGFALAGGYAVQAAGLLERPSEDVDLFTAWERRDDFGAAVTAVVHTYRDDDLTVEVDLKYDTLPGWRSPTVSVHPKLSLAWTGAPTNPS